MFYAALLGSDGLRAAGAVRSWVFWDGRRVQRPVHDNVLTCLCRGHILPAIINVYAGSARGRVSGSCLKLEEVALCVWR